MFHTRLCEIFGIKYPVILGGMAYAGDHRLAAAVSNAGGLGVIGSGNLTVDELVAELEAYRKLSDKPLGINVFMKRDDTPAKAEAICSMGVAALFTGIGNPMPVVPFAKKAGIPVIPTIAAVKHASAVLAAGADLIVAEGQEGGGHIGTISTLPLVAQVRNAIGTKAPLIAAGGIGDGTQLVACLAMGAVGVMMGTRFLIADECPIHGDVKKRLLECGAEDTTVTGRFTGFPMRCLANEFTSTFRKEEITRGYEMLNFGAGKINAGLMEGDINNGSLPAGQVVGQITKHQSAADIMDEIITEAGSLTSRIIGNKGFDGWR